MKYDTNELESMRPLPEATFYIHTALADCDRHGYGILQEVAARTKGKIASGGERLYRSLQRMLEQGLIRRHA